MNRILKNSGGQSLFFTLPNPAGGGVAGDTGQGYVSLDGGAIAALGTPVISLGNGLYQQALTTAETNGDVLAFTFVPATGGIPSVGDVLRTESSFGGGDAVLAAAQPHYAPAKAGDAMSLVANQDVRNILGSVAGDVQGDVIGSVQLPDTLPASVWNSFLDLVNGIQTGLTVRQGLVQLIAALVDVTVGLDLSAHAGPSSSTLAPRFSPKARTIVGIAAVQLLKAVEFNEANPELGLLSPNLVRACHQLATALDAVRTASA